MLRKVVAAFNTKDLEALGKLIADKILLVDSDGVSSSGREAVLAHYSEAFTDAPRATIEGTLQSLQFLTEDVARGDGTFLLDPEPGAIDPSSGRFSILAIRQGDAWHLAELRDTLAPGEEHADSKEHLRQFEWMIGHWVDESGDARISSDIHWAMDRNYILRDYSIEVAGKEALTGLMVLGYDPQAGQVKSWVFDSEGGHGEADWTRVNDTQWVLRSRGHLRDGTPTSASQVITKLGEDSVRQNSLDRMIGGQLVPEVTEVVMVRRPPSPSLKPEGEAKQKDAPTRGRRPRPTRTTAEDRSSCSRSCTVRLRCFPSFPGSSPGRVACASWNSTFRLPTSIEAFARTSFVGDREDSHETHRRDPVTRCRIAPGRREPRDGPAWPRWRPRRGWSSRWRGRRDDPAGVSTQHALAPRRGYDPPRHAIALRRWNDPARIASQRRDVPAKPPESALKTRWRQPRRESAGRRRQPRREPAGRRRQPRREPTRKWRRWQPRRESTRNRWR